MRILRYTPQGHPRHSGKIIIDSHDQEKAVLRALARMWIYGDVISLKTEDRPPLLRRSVEKHSRRRMRSA